MAATVREQGYVPTVLVLLSAVVLAQAAVTWDQTTVNVKQGEQVTIRCTLDKLEPFGMMQVYKRIQTMVNCPKGEKTPCEKDVPITDKSYMKEPFLATNRYTSIYTDKENTENKILTLTIDNIQGADAGKIGCKSVNKPADTAFVTINVQVKVSSVYILRKKPSSEVRVRDGETVRLRHGKDLGVACVATMNGTRALANMTIYVDDKNVTKDFKREVVQIDIASVDGLKDYYSENKLIYEPRKPNPDWNRKQLRCEAEADGFKKETVSVNLEIKYPPVVKCKKYSFFGQIHSKLTIKCDVKSYPNSTIMWQWTNTKGTHSKLRSGRTKEGLTANEKALGPDHKEVTLTFGQLEGLHFKKYILTASNDITTVEVQITVNKGQEPEPKQVRSGATSQLNCLGVLMSALLLWLLS